MVVPPACRNPPAREDIRHVSDWVQRHLSSQSDPEQFAEACQIVRAVQYALRDVLATHPSETPEQVSARLRAARALTNYKDGPA